MSTARDVYALLVGIDAYPRPVSPLRGCRNDVLAVAGLLEKRVTSAGDTLHVKTLLDEEATRDAVIAGFREHLGQAKEGDVALFHYSGHGSQDMAPSEFWHLEPDHLNETLVLWDSRLDGRWDLADKELAALLTEVAAENPHIFVVLDCCHSGSGTRAELEDGIGSRRAPTDMRPRPLSSFLFDPSGIDEIVRADGSERAALGDSGWSRTRANHILLSGCRSNETSKEVLHDGSSRGAMTVALVSAIENAGNALTYRELHRQVRATVGRTVRRQNPQLESSSASDLDRPFLGGAADPAQPWFTVTHGAGDWTMDGGRVHGITTPQGEEAVRVAISDPDGAEVATADVIRVRPGDSTLSVKSGDLDPARSYRAVVVSTPLPRLIVRIIDDGGAADTGGADALRAALAADGGPDLVREAGPEDEPQIEVLVEPGGFAITRRGGKRQLWPRAKSATEAVAILERVAVWMTAFGLGNPASRLPREAVKIQFDAEPDPGQSLPFEVDGGYRLEYLTEDRSRPRGYTVTLTNTTNRPLWVALIDLTDTFGIYTDALESGSQHLDPGESLPIELLAIVPDELWEGGITEVTDVLKVIVATEEFDPRPMEQSDLDVSAPVTRSARAAGGAGAPLSALDRLLRRVATRRAKPPAAEEPGVDWFTRDLTVMSVRPRPGVATSQDETGTLAAGVVVRPHPSLRATVQLTTADDATRDLAAAPVPEPLQVEGTMSFTLTTTREGGAGSDSLLLHVDPESPAEAVTTDQPLVITVDRELAAGEHLLPFAWDGEFYIPLGHARPSRFGPGTDIVIERLSEPVATARDLRGAIRILFRKLVGNVFGLPPAYPVLRLATVSDEGVVSYDGNKDAVKQAVAAADSVVVYVHGITGDTLAMARSSRYMATTGANRAVLAFDYESVHTIIEENAASLGAMLAGVGLGEGHGKRLDVVAHSMGGLVSRHLVERIGGVGINQLITVGTPHLGSEWADVQKWATAAIAFAANGFIPVAWPVTVLSALLGAIEKVDRSLDQMEPGSGFVKQLGNAPDPHTRYQLLVGDRSLIPAVSEETAPGGVLARLLGRLNPGKLKGKIADLVFFNKPNDLAVTVTSAQGVPEGRDPVPQVHLVPSDHVSFFEEAPALEVLSDVLSMSEVPTTGSRSLTRSERTVTPNDVVVVLPGIMGSTLGVARDGAPAANHMVWAPTSGAIWRGATSGFRSITGLRLPAGIGDDHPGDGVEPIGLMPTVHAIPRLWTPIHGYTELLAFLEELGFRRQRPGDPYPGNLLPMPYDWRLSNRYNGRRLARIAGEALERWRAQGGRYKDAKLVLIGHSMGGLVARWFIEKEGGAEITRKLITLGTPWRGAATALEQLVNGIRKGAGPFTLDLTEFSRSLPSLYQLLPEYACIEQGTGYLKITETTLPDLDSARAADAMSFHTALQTAETARPGALTDTHMIVGTRQPTATTIRRTGSGVVAVRTIAGREDFGDGTVPMPGAVGLGQAPNSNLLRRVVDQHGHLQSNRAVHDELQEILTAQPVAYREAEGRAPLRVLAPDFVAANEDLPIEVDIDTGEDHALVVAVHDENGALLAQREPEVRNAHAEAVFAAGTLPAGIVTVTVRGMPGRPVQPVTATTLVWNPQ